MSTVSSPNMSMPVPVVGDEAGPTYAIDINACLSILDSHSHVPGSGVQITPSALNINSDLSMQGNDLTGIRSTRFGVQSSPLAAASDLGCAYVSGVDLYYNDINGNQIQITQAGGIAGTPGSIANLVSPASASYVALNETFVWQSNANVAASMDMRSAILRNSSASSFGLTLQAPTLAADATQTLPQVPAATSFMTMASTGAMGTSIPIALGITSSMLAADSVVTSKILDANVTLAKMAANSIDTSQIVNQAVTPAKLAPYISGSGTGSASYTTTSASFTTISTTSITVSGTRPVLIVVTNYNTGTYGYFSVVDASNPPIGVLAVDETVSGTVLNQCALSTTVIGTTLSVPASISFVDFPAAGLRTYRLRGKVISSPTTVLSAINVYLTAIEL